MKNEKKKKDFSLILKKITRILKRLWLAIRSFIINLYKKFMDLPKKIRYVIGVWVIVVVALLLFIGGANGSNEFYAKYAAYEKAISEKALLYVEQNNIYATVDNKLVVDLNILKEGKYVTKADIIDDTCDGISVVYYDDEKDEYIIDTYLNCKKYTSKNYWDYK